MEEYPEELRTSPVSLVALFGYSELHTSITKHLHSQQPPINALAFPDFSHISLLLAHDDQINRTSSVRDPLSVSDSSSPIPSRCGGILKRDWLLKHRTKVPAIVAAFFPSHHIFGDPTQWLQVCSDLDNLKYFLISLAIDAYMVFAFYKMIGTSTRLPAIQRLVEIKTIAEQLHFKISTLLLHGGKLIEAVTWFRQHKASYEKVVGSTEFIFLHWEWMSR